ncbi:hypothetical protein B0H16DRAFT_1446347 [Mycena metata]|uniref:Uncharacterized protein n=1 Tax=Mycena metata TaxID=1033252 RepID=A0AAD7KJ32_9AGAR|nr:hypothetical protein B0H16DRAFT_1446347 [Mycena metata]
MLAWLDTLSADVTAQVVFGVELGSSDEEIVAMRLTQALILSMRNKLIELKVSLGGLCEGFGGAALKVAFLHLSKVSHSPSALSTTTILATLGTEWLPYGLDSCPFQMDFERVPAEATERREFQCSATLESYLVEFYHDIRPKLQTFDLMIRNIYSFKIRLMHAMLAWMGTMPADAIAQVQLGSGIGRSDEETLAMRLTRSNMLSMRDELIELKIVGWPMSKIWRSDTRIHLHLGAETDWNRGVSLLSPAQDVHRCHLPIDYISKLQAHAKR